MIRILSEEEIGQIAAGEIILNVLFVLKELIENSIDAKSTNIIIRLKNNGKDLIEVEDNGIGINAHNMLLCTRRYATSKFIDLNSIYTLGFRGEALYAIEQVSNISIISQQNIYKNNQISPIATNEGTIIKVENLFYNLPARKKFLNKQILNIESFLESYILAYSNIKFLLYINNKRKYLNDSISKIFHLNYDNRINFSSNRNGYKINGSIFVGHKHKYFIFLNNRVLQDRNIMNIVRNTYASVSGYTSVSFIIFIECNINLYDVNIHPSKYEVEFHDNIIFKEIEKTIKESCNYWQVLYEESNIVEAPNVWLLNENNDDILINTHSINKQYIMYIYEKKFVIMDMHAAHERILSYTLLKNSVAKQLLLSPIKYRLLPEQISLWSCDIIKKLFDYSINNNILIITSASIILKLNDIMEIIQNSYNTLHVEEYLNNIIHEKGCHNAIKTGQTITQDDKIELLNTLLKTPNYAICNHGRPTLMTFNINNLNNMFHRT